MSPKNKSLFECQSGYFVGTEDRAADIPVALPVWEGSPQPDPMSPAPQDLGFHGGTGRLIFIL